MLPTIAILYASYVHDHRPGHALLTAAFIVTLVTQQPFVQMDMTHYFRDWLPGYIYRTYDATPAFWSAWWVRIAMTAAGVLALGAVQQAGRSGGHVRRVHVSQVGSKSNVFDALTQLPICGVRCGLES
jgi:hypothetical protein